MRRGPSNSAYPTQSAVSQDGLQYMPGGTERPQRRETESRTHSEETYEEELQHINSSEVAHVRGEDVARICGVQFAFGAKHFPKNTCLEQHALLVDSLVFQMTFVFLTPRKRPKLRIRSRFLEPAFQNWAPSSPEVPIVTEEEWHSRHLCIGMRTRLQHTIPQLHCWHTLHFQTCIRRHYF